MSTISLWVISTFVLTTLATLWFFFRATNNFRAILGLTGWMMITGALGLAGFYQVTDTIPPRFIFLIGPGAIVVLLVMLNSAGQRETQHWQLSWLTLLHTIRIPVEIVLYEVYLAGQVPDLMTFVGYNYDILSGLSAPIIYYLVLYRKGWTSRVLLWWNFIALGLLANILIIAVFSAETPFQLWAFDQPNIGVTYFPFIWLPAVIVPIVLLSHLVSIRQLLATGRRETMSEV